ncbi:MIP/aquaporin family protein [Pontimonas sp.]|uniref:MIP/aquaporin family protein n=1 Tax=Pontimonas sp. TaxID=2304492 RepID=UPI0028705BDA|nr:MIP/aquaporin family protein [Pontimonas sp.]MDR9396930.1 MIP/aquaporin family protein [Pontimonas sp.]MDR9434336.1 MIP/aquaporin family protein [Pontimonas sp.]
MPAPLRLLAEFLGTAVLVMAVVGSGLLGQALSADLGVVILINQLATVMILGVLVALLMPVSGAHINPAVTLVMAIRREISPGLAVGYVLVQLAGGVFGTVVAHVMFERQVLEFSTNDRLSLGTFVGEVVATAGLLALILTAVYQQRSHLLPLLVPAWIGAAFFFTSSTSFANPAVALGRMFTDSFSGIAPGSVTGFIGAQVVGALLAIVLVLPFAQAHKKEVS